MYDKIFYHIFLFLVTTIKVIKLIYFLLSIFTNMRLLWYLVSVFNIVLILLNNPKTGSVNSIGGQMSTFKSTRSTQQGLQLLIGVNVIIFFILTIFSALFLSI